MEILGYFGALVIGISLGLIGGGGSILTVPVLTYLFGITAVTATSYSLFIVGTTALVGAARSYFNRNIEIRLGIIFAIPSIIAVWLARAVLVPAIPDPIFQTAAWVLTKDMGVMIFFALIMVVSSFSMLRKGKHDENSLPADKKRPGFLIVLEGLAVGTITGIVGAGGGFLIIPALVLLAGMPMKKAIGTSLMIIALKSLLGFTGDLMNPEIVIDWTMMLIFSALSVAGIFIGIQLSHRISGGQLKRGFGIFILIMGVYIMIERLSNM